MNRRSLIICFSALAAMIVMIVAAVAFLYRDDENAAAVCRYDLAYAVPSNAVAACFLSDASKLSSPALMSFDFNEKLAGFLSSESAGRMQHASMALSLHYSGSLAPLYVFAAGEASDEPTPGAEALIKFAGQHGYHAEFVNCSSLTEDGPLASSSVILIAKTKAQLSISKSHIREGRSLMDADGFSEVSKAAPGDVLFFSYDNAKVLFEKIVLRSYFTKRFSKTSSSEFSSAASFFSSFADWGVVSLAKDHSFDMVHDYDEGSDFLSVMAHDANAVSSVSKMLPSTTRFALTLPMSSSKSYIVKYSAYLESAQKKGQNQDWQGKLSKASGVSPSTLVDRLGISEVSTAAFPCGNDLEWVNLMKIERADTVLLRGTGDVKMDSSPKTRPYAFAGHAASVFGKFFRLADESHFAVMNGWLVTGSQKAVEEYVSGIALAYDLKTYMADAGKSDLLAVAPSACVAYVNIPKEDKWLAGILGKEMHGVYDVLKGEAEYSPMVLTMVNDGGNILTDISFWHLQRKRSRAPKVVKDVEVAVPSGPFTVVNSGTGRNNRFYQQSNGAICLEDESGKGLWGVPFKKKLCGTAHNIDYYANGNKQILFGAGSELYLIDRTGRFVKGFPVDLGKEILLGPDVYDFNGVNAYNVLVLHKDKTIEMYNLHGKKPESWKGISCNETITSLPERVFVGDKSFWVVRTSVQTLIYPFYGGQPLNSFKGDQMFLPDASVKVKDSRTLEAECYDGKIRAVKIK